MRRIVWYAVQGVVLNAFNSLENRTRSELYAFRSISSSGAKNPRSLSVVIVP